MPIDPRAFSGIALMGGPMSVNDGLAWKAPLVVAIARGGRWRDSGDRPLPRRAARWRRRWGRRSRARRSPRSAGSTSTSATMPPSTNGSAAGRVHHVPVALRRVRVTRGCGAGADERVQRQPGVRRRGRHIGFQCHVEMTRELIETWLATGADELPALPHAATQSAADIRRDLDARIDCAACRRRRRLRALGAADSAVASAEHVTSAVCRPRLKPHCASGGSRAQRRHRAAPDRAERRRCSTLSRFHAMPLTNAAR